MKSIFLSTLFLSVFLFAACEKDNASPANDLSGTWQLVEVLADPGDGSGTFQPVDSDRTITFGADGAYTATGDLCDFQIMANSSSSGLYDLEEGTISPENCATIGGTPIGLSVDGSTMIITYLCIEACQHKYERQ